MYTYEISQEHNCYPGMTAYDRLRDGNSAGWKIMPNEDYVMRDTSDEAIEIDPETGEERPAIFYYTVAFLPRTCNWNQFTWVAVPRKGVDAAHIN